MTLKTLPSFLRYGPIQTYSTALNSFTLNDNTGTQYMAFRLRAPKSGTIDRVHHSATNPTANGSGLRARIETDNGSGRPSGTLFAGSSEVVLTISSTGWHRSGAGLGAVVTKGDLIHVVFRAPPSGTAYNGTMNIGIPELFPSTDRVGGEIYPIYNNGSDQIAGGIAPFAIEYLDGTIPALSNVWPWNGLGYTETFNTGSSPDERGVKFKLPFRCRISGVWSVGAVSTPGSFALKLYDASDTLLANALGGVVPGYLASVGGLLNNYQLSEALVLEPNTTYRMTVTPQDANSGQFYWMPIDTSNGTTALREAAFGSLWQHTYRTDAGAWTDVDDQYPAMGLLIDQLDDGVSPVFQSKSYTVEYR